MALSAVPRGQIAFTVERGELVLTPLRLERDIHWTSGDYDETTSVQLGADEYFMLGDNSSNSQDSRSRGPVHASRIVGRPLLVVWPPARAFVIPR